MSPLLAAPILLTLTLLVSGIAKLPEREGTVDAMTSLRIPLRALHPVAAVVVPVAELVLALALWVPWPPLQVTAAVLVALLMATYLVIIARALTFEEAVHCSCFGTLASPTVSRATLYRNITLTFLGIIGVVAAATGAMLHAENVAPLQLIGWGLAFTVAVALTSFALGGVAPSTDTTAPGATGGGGLVSGADADEELEDYLRTPIPYAVLERADGSTVLLRELAVGQAVLVVLLAEGCGPCNRILPQVAGWAERLTPLVAVQPVFHQRVANLAAETVEQAGGDPLHDLDGNMQRALGAGGSPMAALLGADGFTAGGPVIGSGAVEEFVADVLAQIEEAREAGELPPPGELPQSGQIPQPSAEDADDEPPASVTIP